MPWISFLMTMYYNKNRFPFIEKSLLNHFSYLMGVQLKVRQSLNDFFKPTFPPKNKQMNSILLLWDLFLFVFWKKLKTQKRRFESNWPLVLHIRGPWKFSLTDIKKIFCRNDLWSKISCVSCAAWNVFPINSLLSVWSLDLWEQRLVGHKVKKNVPISEKLRHTTLYYLSALPFNWILKRSGNDLCRYSNLKALRDSP